MKRFTIIFALLLAQPSSLIAGISFDRYHSQDEISQYLREVAATHSEIAEFKVLGSSGEGREVAYLKIGAPGQKKPVRIYLNGTHHGNETSSTESALAMIDHLVRNRQVPAIARLLNSHELYIQPLVNPDGHAAGTRGDSQGRDPNRDYAVPGEDSSKAFALPETQLVKGLLDRVAFDGAIAFHSGMEGVLWPWCHSPLPTNHQLKYKALAQKVAEAMKSALYKQSWQDYPTRGEFADYAYYKHGTLGVTLEVSSAPAPEAASLKRILHRAVKGTLAYIRGLSSQGIAGISAETNVWAPFQTIAMQTHNLSGIAGMFSQVSREAPDEILGHH